MVAQNARFTSTAARADASHGPAVVKLLDPGLNDLTPRHLEVWWRYQVIRTAVDFGAAVCFVIGSAFFFFVSTTTAADWLFLVGSLLFAMKPTIDISRSAHLRRLPGQADGPSHRAPPLPPS